MDVPPPEHDPYEVLGVGREATLLEIARAHRRLAKAHHPDLSTDPRAAERMRAINAAWRTLAQPASRATWDRMHRMPAPVPAVWVPPPSRGGPGAEAGGQADGGGGWWIGLTVMMILLVVVLIGGVMAAASRPPIEGSNSPGYHGNAP